MQLLADRIKTDARHLGKGVIKVDSFMNHQIDPVLMQAIGEEFAQEFASAKPTRILTAETSGIAPAVAAGMFLKVPVVFARKHQPITMKQEPYREVSVSPTHKKEVEFVVSTEYLKGEDKVLIIDDFLASAKTIVALSLMVEKSGAELVGIGAVIEKVYANGRDLLSHLNVPIVTLAKVIECKEDQIILG